MEEELDQITEQLNSAILKVGLIQSYESAIMTNNITSSMKQKKMLMKQNEQEKSLKLELPKMKNDSRNKKLHLKRPNL